MNTKGNGSHRSSPRAAAQKANGKNETIGQLEYYCVGCKAKHGGTPTHFIANPNGSVTAFFHCKESGVNGAKIMAKSQLPKGVTIGAAKPKPKAVPKGKANGKGKTAKPKAVKPLDFSHIVNQKDVEKAIKQSRFSLWCSFTLTSPDVETHDGEAFIVSVPHADKKRKQTALVLAVTLGKETRILTVNTSENYADTIRFLADWLR